MAGQHYCLRWNNYQSNMTSVFHQLLQNEDFVDVTLACNDLSLKAHKVVLSACSSYFQKLLLENPCKHPTIIMPQDVCFSDLKFIIEFVYRGEIDVSQAELQSLLKTADQLKIKGLCEVPEAKEGQTNNPETTLPIISRRSFTKLRRLSGSKRPHRNEMTKREIFRECDQQVETVSCDMDLGVSELPIRHDPIGPDRMQGGCVTVATSTEEDDVPVIVLEPHLPTHQQDIKMQGIQLLNDEEHSDMITPHSIQSQHMVLDGTNHSSSSNADVELSPETQPPGPTATLVENLDMQECSHERNEMEMEEVVEVVNHDEVKVKFETLRAMEQSDTLDMDNHLSDRNVEDEHTMHTMMITPELLGLIPSSSVHSDMGSDGGKAGPKTWTQEDMDLALDALRNHNMSLTKASATYGIPSTTLWQRAHRLGIDTPKKEGPTKSWTEDSLNSALEALRTGTISANKASKAFGIPSSTLYKIARREGIRLAAPFNAAPTTWSPDDLERALESIRSGVTSVQRASTEFGIPTGTLYGRCKREGIELSRSNPTPWSEDAMLDALEAVRIGQMSINQAAIHYNLPYSSLYGRFKRVKYEAEGHPSPDHMEGHSHSESPTNGQSQALPPQIMVVQYQQHPPQHLTQLSNQSPQQQHHIYQHTTS